MKYSLRFAVGGVLMLLAASYWSQQRALKVERDINHALRRRMNQMVPCDEAVRESRRLLEKQIKLRNMSNSTAQNMKGYQNYEEYDNQFSQYY